MSKSIDEDVVLDDMTEDVEETVDTEEVETETSEEPETEVSEPEAEEEDDDTETSEEPEEKPEKEPEKPKQVKTARKKVEKKTVEDDTDAELDAFFEKLRKAKEKQQAKKKESGEKTFTQSEFEKALKTALAKRLPPKEEREQFEKWRESQQTMEEKMSVLRVTNTKLEDEIEKLRHENAVIKAGVDKEAVEFIQFKVEKMDGDFEENLQEFLSDHKKYVTPKTTVVEAAEHKPKVKTAITKKDLDAMDYASRAKYKEEHPEEYARAMGR